ncbi:MAG: sensor domain-containing diguanylate cyclase [Gammaproteobacteria bacterium]|nr:sensor domain-containing diguanylate cyclase [Gammaproteobacteria bacterium]
MILKSGNKKIVFHSIIGIIVFIFFIATTELVISLLHENQLDRQRSATLDKTMTMRAKIEGEINSTLHLTQGLIAYVATHPDFDDKEFSQLADEIIFLARNLRNIGLAKNNIITHLYPLVGNEAALGLEYEKLPNQWPAIKKAIDIKGTVVAGPITLIQGGGQAFIARTPIYTRVGDDNLGKQKLNYWGMGSIVINMSELFQAADFSEFEDGLLFALRGKDGMGAEGEMILGDPEVFNSDPVLSLISLPNGSWQIASIPEGGWGTGLGLLWLSRASGWAVAILLGLLISALLRAKEINRSLALQDHLTNLPNRRLLEDRLKQAITYSERDKTAFGLLYLDLDGFKQINDKYGHKVGDDLLVEASKRMLASVRASDTVSRVGGDEFIILSDKISKKNDIKHIQRQLEQNLTAMVYLDAHKIKLRASIGTVIYPDDGKTIDELLKRADEKMYSEKQSGKIQVVNFTQRS